VRLIVVRHGETLYNTNHRLTGQSDVPLNPLGIRQARLVAAYLASEHLDVIVSSDLERTRATAGEIARHHGLPVLEDPDIREISLGEWEGKTLVEVEATDPDVIAQWRANPALHAPVGGETLIQVRERIQRALHSWYARYPDGDVVWVAHGGLIGVLICHLLDIDINRRHQFHHANASVNEFLYSPERISIVRLNEIAFLRELEGTVLIDTVV
jgi:probable phosphoglycerate mutase